MLTKVQIMIMAGCVAVGGLTATITICFAQWHQQQQQQAEAAATREAIYKIMTPPTALPKRWFM